MIPGIDEPVVFFLLVMGVILITPLLSERLHLPGIVGIILGGMLIGPYGFGLLEDNDRIQFLSTIGLIYLMFSAGMEVDIHQFQRVGKRALVFGLLTFFFPLLMGMALGWLLKMEWLGMLLLGSAFSSHTLIAFPILTRLGVARNEAVAVTAGATVLTDISAFIILSIVLGAQSGGIEAGFFIQLILLLALFIFLTVFGLPRLGKLFFQHFSGREVEFQFILVALLVSALAAEWIGVHQVVGAFSAGLAISITLPRHSPVTGHVLFIGNAFFIPIFLLYSGMITDITAFFKGGQTLLIGLGVIMVAYLSKFAAAWITSRLFHYSRSELMTAYGLSHAQAAVTIPTLIIGLQIGLFDKTLFDAAILMILFTSITSPLLVQRGAAGLTQEHTSKQTLPLFARILVSVANPQTQENLLTLACLLARPSGGHVLALHVAQESGGKVMGLQHQQEILERVPEIVNDPETTFELLPRVSRTYAQGIIHTAIERSASLILIGWRGKPNLKQSVFGSVLDEVIWGVETPVLVARLTRSINSMQRLVLLLPPNVMPLASLQRTLQASRQISQALNVPSLVLADASYYPLVQELLPQLGHATPAQVERTRGLLDAHTLRKIGMNDLLLVPGFGSRRRFLSSLGDLPEHLAATISGNLLVLYFYQ